MASRNGVLSVFALFQRYDLANLPPKEELADKLADWLDMLDDVSDQDLFLAARGHIKDPDGGVFFPKIAQIRKHLPVVRAVAAIEEGPVGQAIWTRLLKGISTAGFTRIEGEEPGWLEKLANHYQVDAARLGAAIDAAGGGRAIAFANHDAQRAWMGQKFCRAWDGWTPGASRPQLADSNPIDLQAEIARRKALGGSNGPR
jgi:hypothetical protein